MKLSQVQNQIHRDFDGYMRKTNLTKRQSVFEVAVLVGRQLLRKQRRLKMDNF